MSSKLFPPHQSHKTCDSWPSFELRWWRRRREGCNLFLMLTPQHQDQCARLASSTCQNICSNHNRSASFLASTCDWFGLHLHCGWRESLCCYMIDVIFYHHINADCGNHTSLRRNDLVLKLNYVTDDIFLPSLMHLSLPISWRREWCNRF